MKDFLRQSQVLTTFGPGAMVDLPDRAVLIEGLQGWRFSGGREEVQGPRLVAKLREKLALPLVRLVKPPPFDDRPGVRTSTIGARIFPTWFLVQEATQTGPAGQLSAVARRGTSMTSPGAAICTARGRAAAGACGSKSGGRAATSPKP
jgi:hypothetical protein